MRYADTFLNHWVCVNDNKLIVIKDKYDFDTYVFNNKFIKNSEIDKFIGKEFWVVPHDYNEQVYLCTLINDECGIHFDDILMEKVQCFIIKDGLVKDSCRSPFDIKC